MTRARLLPAVAVAAVAALVLATAPVSPKPEPTTTALPQRAFSNPTLGELGSQPVPGDAALMRTAGKSVVPPTGAFVKMRAQARATAARTRALMPHVAEPEWELHGPQHIGGRVLDVVVDPLRPDAVYAATATGGVWYSTDAGMTYTSVWPDDYVQAIGALAIAPDGTLYAGTGEAGPGGGSLTYGGDGVYRSRDGGKTWKNIGLKGTERIGRIVVDPSDPKRIWVAATGPLFSSGGERGLYRSDNGGDTWELVLEAPNPTTGVVDVAIAPDSDGQTVYAAAWDRLRHPVKRDYTGPGTALYRSKDGGESWAAIGTPSYFGPNNTAIGRLGVATAPGGIVYVLSSTILGVTAGFYSSSDGGDTWIAQPPSASLATGGFVYAWWFGRVYVDPKNPQHVFATGVNLSRSTDGGQSWSPPSGVHADQHGMAWDPRVEDRVYLGNDGGMYVSEDNGATWEHGTYMPWNQLFSIDVSQQRPQRIVGGLQDNGGVRSWDVDGDVTVDSWNDITGGDGTEMRINPENDEIVYGCSQYGACAVSTNGGNSSSSFDAQIIGDRKNWLTPIEFEPGNPSTVYTGSSILHRSTNDGQDWEPISLDLTDGETGSTETNPLFRNYDTISTIAVTSADIGFILVGTDDGNVWYSHDNAANPATSFTKATGLPDDYVTSVAIDPKNPEIAYATFSGFRAGEFASQVYRTTDKGVTWEAIGGDLPQAPVGKVLPIGDDLFVATDVGVFWSPNIADLDGKHWFSVGQGLPMTPVWDLAYQAKTHSLYAASFGRGAYSLPLKDLTPPGSGPLCPSNHVTCNDLPQPGPVPGGPRIPTTGLPAALPLVALLAVAGGLVVARRRRAA